MSEVIRIDRAQDLPPTWDRATAHYYQTRQFLSHCEDWNPCEQTYYLIGDTQGLTAGAVVYSLRLSLLTFSGVSLPVAMRVVGVPCSVSQPGLFGTSEGIRDLLGDLRCQEKAFLLALNLDENLSPPDGFTAARTLPTVAFAPPAQNWEDYLKSMRADYRRRVRSIMARSARLTVDQVSCAEFTQRHHHLYQQVWKRSQAKLEMLSAEFFQNLPGEFSMMTARLQEGHLTGWAIVLETDRGIDFFLGGVDEANNRQQAVYFRLLLEVVRLGIGNGAPFIDLGQTAEIPKMRLGGVCRPLQLAATHGNPLWRFLLKKSARLLEYRRQVPQHHVFGGAP